MSTPTPILIGGIYAHPKILGHRLFRVISVNETHIILRPVEGKRRLIFEDTLNHFTSGCYTLVDPGNQPADDLMAIADAVGVTPDTRPAGQQPSVEFTAGPLGPGPLWADEHLAQVFFGGEPA